MSSERFSKARPPVLPIILPVKRPKVWDAYGAPQDVYNKAIRQVSFFQKLLDFLPRAQLAWETEVADPDMDSTNVRDPKFVDLRGGLNKAFWNNSKVYFGDGDFVAPSAGSTVSPETPLGGNYGSTYFSSNGRPVKYVAPNGQSNQLGFNDLLHGYLGDWERNTYGRTHKMYDQSGYNTIPAGFGNTWLHNLNVYHGADSWNPFKDTGSLEYQDFSGDAVDNQFMSPLNILKNVDSGLWAKINSDVTAMQNTSNPAWLSPDGSHTLNWNNAPNSFSDTPISTYNIKANYYEIVMSQMWKDWTPAQTFSFITQSWEAKKRGFKAYKDLWGRVFDMPNPEAPLDWDTPNAAVDKELTRSAGMESNLKNWANQIGTKVTNPALLYPYKLMVTLTHQSGWLWDAWGYWDTEQNGLYDAEIYATNSVDNGASDFQDKMVRGYLNYVVSTYMPGLKSSFGAITLYDPESQTTKSLGNSLTSADLTSGTTVNRYYSTRAVYNRFMNLFEAMTDTHITSASSYKPSQGLPITTTTSAESPPVTTYSIVLQPAGTDIAGGAIAGVTYSTTNLADITTLFSKVRQVLALLEPVVGSFDPRGDLPSVSATAPIYTKNSAGAYQVQNALTRVLIDNQGSIESSGTITDNNPDYAIQLDFIPHGNPTITSPTHDTDLEGQRGYDRVFRLPKIADKSPFTWGPVGTTIENAIGLRTRTDPTNTAIPFLDTWTSPGLMSHEYVHKDASAIGDFMWKSSTTSAGTPGGYKIRGSSPDSSENWARAAMGYAGNVDTEVVLDIIMLQDQNRRLKNAHRKKIQDYRTEKSDFETDQMQRAIAEKKAAASSRRRHNELMKSTRKSQPKPAQRKKS